MTEMIQSKITSYFFKIIYIICLLRTRVHAESCQIKVRDPKWHRQWYMGAKYMNVMPAWRQCFNGTGVTVAVVDIGVQNHRDLTINRDLKFNFHPTYSSYNFPRIYHSFQWSYSSDRYRTNLLKHGTRVAGLIAAKQNNLDISGIAFGAEIADITIASSSMFENFDPSALIHKQDQIDIYSCSFGNVHTGLNIYPLKENLSQVLQHGVDFGRSRKGSIYVIGTGNSGDPTDLFPDSCAYDGFINNRFVIPVAGIRRDFSKVPNGEMCSSILVSAFTSQAGERNDSYKLVTLDINDGTTTYLVDNSAAVPMISGAIALALSANPALTYRDVMHLLVQTSKNTMNDNFDLFFQKNGAQFRYSQTFGFGFVDIGHLVNKSRTWTNVPEHKECEQEETNGKPIVNALHDLLVTSCDITYIEHVEVTLRIMDSDAGQLTWHLLSPAGTSSKILPGRKFDSRKNMTISVVTVQMWGENPRGRWRLSVENSHGNQIDGDILSWKLRLYGFTCVDGGSTFCSQPVIAEDPIEIWTEWTPWSLCSRTCGGGFRSRTRQCFKNNLLSSPTMCSGEGNQYSNCSMNLCPKYGTWSDWNTCTVTCGTGTQTRQRQCNQAPCGEQLMDTRSCNTQVCPGEMSEWSSWTTCFYCRRRRFRYCTSESPSGCKGQTQQSACCKTQIPNEIWTNWSPWSPCSQTCGGGSKSRTRHCFRNNQLSLPLMCSGEGKQYSVCNMDLCPKYGTWSDWNTCTVACGTGTQTRQRQCNQASCGEQLMDTRSCNTQVCSALRVWSEWGQCSKTCGPGIRSREMRCNGRRCIPSDVDIAQCNLQTCVTDCHDINNTSDCLRWKNRNNYCLTPGAEHWCKFTCGYCGNIIN